MYKSLHLNEAQPLAYIVAENNNVRPQGLPVLGALCVVEFKAVLHSLLANLEDVGLVYVPEQCDWARAVPGAQTAVWASVFLA